MLDLDLFKKVNDLHGHEEGDLMLMHFTSLIRSVMRKSDDLARYGGEEFILILPETDARGAHFVLGRQQVMARTPLNYEGKQIDATFSAGIATLKPDENGQALLRRADDAVYAAKNAGRPSNWRRERSVIATKLAFDDLHLAAWTVPWRYWRRYARGGPDQEKHGEYVAAKTGQDQEYPGEQAAAAGPHCAERRFTASERLP